MSELEFIAKVIELMNSCDCFDELRVVVKRDGGEIKLEPYILCNDLFFWGCADLEKVTKDNLRILEESVNALLGDEYDKHEYIYAPLLFCARARGQRPQTAFYNSLPEKTHHLFDACGNELSQYGSKAFWEAHAPKGDSTE